MSNEENDNYLEKKKKLKEVYSKLTPANVKQAEIYHKIMGGSDMNDTDTVEYD